jgi:hypothetical protein
MGGLEGGLVKFQPWNHPSRAILWIAASTLGRLGISGEWSDNAEPNRRMKKTVADA